MQLQVLLNRPIDRPSEVDSVGGLVAHILDDGVQSGTATEWDGLLLRIEEDEEGRASRVHVSRLPTEG